MFKHYTIQSDTKVFKISALIDENENFVMPSFEVAENEYWDSEQFLYDFGIDLIEAHKTKNYQHVLDIGDGNIQIEDVEELAEMFSYAFKIGML